MSSCNRDDAAFLEAIELFSFEALAVAIGEEEQRVIDAEIAGDG